MYILETESVICLPADGLVNQGFQFSLKDAALHNPVMGMIGVAIFGGMADGIFPDRKEAVDEGFILVIMRQCQVHLVNRGNHLAPLPLPFSDRGTLPVG